MKIRYMGTAAAEGIPGLFCSCSLCKQARAAGGKDCRTRSQVLLDDALLIDFPPDTYHHFLATPAFEPAKIRHLLLTHSHADHFYPQDIALRCEGFAAKLQDTLTVYGNSAVATAWNTLLEGEYHHFADLPEKVRFVTLSPYQETSVGSFTVTALPADHVKREQCLIYLIRRNGKTLLYANDTGTQLEDAAWKALSVCHLDAVSMDCTAMDRLVGRYHMGLPDNAIFKEKLLALGCANADTRFIVTHFSHFGGLCHESLTQKAAAYGFETAYDGMELTF